MGPALRGVSFAAVAITLSIAVTITALWGVSFAAVAITITNTINDAATIVIRSIGRVLQHAVGDEPQPPT